MKVQIYGPIDGPTGYDEITRNLIFGFYLRGETVVIKPFVGWSSFTVSHQYKELFDKLQARQDNRPIDININVCLPCQAQPVQHAVNILYSMFEADRIPQSWVDSANLMDVVVVPTEFCRKAWIRSGVALSKLRVVPIGLDCNNLYNPAVKPIELYTGETGEALATKYKYRFLHMQEFVSRKNLEGLLQAWELATNTEGFPTTEACLLLKVNSYSGSRLKTLGSVLKKFKFKAPVYLYSRVIAEAALPGIYSLATHYITLSFGEGWGLSEHKSGLMGKVVIAPESTSFTTFLTKDTAYLIPATRVSAQQEGATGGFYEGAYWYQPDVAAAADAIVKSIGDTERGPKLAAHLKANFSFGKYIEGVYAVCADVLKPKPLVAISATASPQVLHYCSSYGQECGIANYTKTLYNTLQETYKNLSQMLIGGSDLVLDKMITTNKLTTVHLHLEYQFMNPQRIKHLANMAHARGISFVVTMHTVNREAPQYHAVLSQYADKIIVQSDAMKKEYLLWGGWNRDEKDIMVIPLACDATGLLTSGSAAVNKRFVVGFFGFTYFHKGLDKLLLAISALSDQPDRAYFLRAFSKKPKQDAVGYAEYCDWLMKKLNLQSRVLWNTDYLEEAKLIQYLSACNIIILPYSDYGGVGVSAAIRTCMKAGTPIITSDSTFFSDIPNELALKVSDLSEIPNVIVEAANGHNAEKVANFVALRDKFVKENSFNVVAAKYMDLYCGKLNG